MASGEHRNVFHGVYSKGPRKGQRSVEKVFKTGSVYEAKYFEDDLRVVAKAAELIRAFNGYTECSGRHHGAKRFYLNQPDVWTGTKNGKKYLVEPYLSGRYRKFNSNTGWTEDRDSLAQALSHHSYHASGGQYLLCDVQGVERDGHFVLTDPAVHSQDGTHGPTDGGADGMVSWFARHRCNRWCGEGWRRAAPFGGEARHPALSGTSFFPPRPAELSLAELCGRARDAGPRDARADVWNMVERCFFGALPSHCA